MTLTFTNWIVTLSVLDVGGLTSEHTYMLRGADYDEASTNALAFRTAFQNVTGCAVIGMNVGGKYAEDALVAPTSPGALNSMDAFLTVDIADNPTKHASVSIPGPLDLVFVSTTGKNRNIVNAANSFVIAFVNQFKAGGSVFISDGEDVDTVPNISGVRRTKFKRQAK